MLSIPKSSSVVWRGALTPSRVSKSTLRFPVSQPVPERLIERIAKFRAREVARKANAKLALRRTDVRA